MEINDHALIAGDRPLDSDNRLHVADMTDRELMEEIVTGMRSTRTLVESFIADFASNPMMGSLMKMFGGRR